MFENKNIFIGEIRGTLDGIKERLKGDIMQTQFKDGIVMLFTDRTDLNDCVEVRGVKVRGGYFFVNGSEPGKYMDLTDNQIRRLLKELTKMCDKHINKRIRESNGRTNHYEG